MCAKEKGYRVISFRVTDQELAALDEAASEAGLSRSEYVRACLSDPLEEAEGSLAQSIRSLSSAADALWELRRVGFDGRERLDRMAAMFEEKGDGEALELAQEAMQLLGEIQEGTLDALELTVSSLQNARRDLDIG